MRAIWTGSIGFGLVNIPVKMYSGSESRAGLDLHMLHKADSSPIRYARICRRDGKEIPYDEIVKGYEYQDGDYITLSSEDFKKADARKTKTLEIRQFADESEIDSRYYDKPYYLEPGRGAEQAYRLLHEALKKSGKVALVKYAMRARDNMGAVKPIGHALVLNQMRFPADVRRPTDLNLPDSEVGEAELKMALALIDQLTKPFIAEDWHDTYTEELEEIIEQKAKGHEPKTHGSEPRPTKVKDLMSTLKASLESQKA
ncbi:MAG TPA: Ku protein [Candidatus Saccharimonadales bacterium]|nr:Ku protein [Candidatus Saccharimonadales bacterium]